jgi:hypothetical protein
MTHKGHGRSSVQLTAVQIEKVINVAAARECNARTLRFLCWVFGSHKAVEAVPALLMHLPQSPSTTQAEILKTLGIIGDREGVQAIRGYLVHRDEKVRRGGLGGLAWTCEDHIDRRLLGEFLLEDDLRWLDPRALITTKRVLAAASQLKRPEAEIRQRYESLAERFSLKLGWNHGTRPRRRRFAPARR